MPLTEVNGVAEWRPAQGDGRIAEAESLWRTLVGMAPRQRAEILLAICGMDHAGELKDLVTELPAMESPLEQMMCVWLKRWADWFLSDNKVWGHDGRSLWVNPWYEMHRQQPITTRGGTYRADFVITVYQWIPNMGPAELGACVIECDGHDYHERTKQQARHDRKRDRDMQAAGYVVFRFTGSEIHRDPSECARQCVRDIIACMIPRVRPVSDFTRA